MKNLFKTSKRGIAAILTLCILLDIAGTCVYAASAMTEETVTATEGTTQELVPMMASACDDYGYTGWASLDAAMNYYGTDFTYTTLRNPIIRNGNIYTHYYTFSDGSRMYFGVI